MPIIKKKDIILEKTQSEETIDELVNPEGGAIDGSIPNLGTNNIQTGPYTPEVGDTDSQYVKGRATTTDRAARYKQNLPWYASGSSSRRVTEVISKRSVEEKIEDLVKKSSDRELYSKSSEADLKRVINLIKNGDFSKEQVKDIENQLKDINKIKNI